MAGNASARRLVKGALPPQADAGRRFGSNATENTRPQAAAPMERPQQQQQPQQNRGNWQRFGEPGGSARPAAPSPRSNFKEAAQSNPGSRYGQPGGSVVRERPSAPQYSAPRYSAPAAPSYSQPSRPSGGDYGGPRGDGNGAPRYSAPRAPSYSQPSRPSGGGYSGPRGGGGSSYSPPPRPSGGGIALRAAAVGVSVRLAAAEAAAEVAPRVVVTHPAEAIAGVGKATENFFLYGPVPFSGDRAFFLVIAFEHEVVYIISVMESQTLGATRPVAAALLLAAALIGRKRLSRWPPWGRKLRLAPCGD